VCAADNTTETPVGVEYGYSCKRCGEFMLAFPGRDLGHTLGDDIEKRAKLSHWIRTNYEAHRNEPPDKDGGKSKPYLRGELVNSILKNGRPFLVAQVENLVRWIGDNTKIGGQYIDVDKLAIQAIVGSATFDEFELVFRYLRDKGLIEHKSGGGDIWVKVTLSFSGWERYQEIKRTASDSRRAFMAMQYDNKQLAEMFEKVFQDAVAQTGFDLHRLVDTPQPAGLIDDDLRVKIRASRFLIADLTDRNPGAYWEGGYAEGLGKPVIYTCRRDIFDDSKSCPHFDTNHHLTILWESDADKRKEVGDKLKATIRATLPAEAKLTDD
jgi:hypothetical protein